MGIPDQLSQLLNVLRMKCLVNGRVLSTNGSTRRLTGSLHIHNKLTSHRQFAAAKCKAFMPCVRSTLSGVAPFLTHSFISATLPSLQRGVMVGEYCADFVSRGMVSWLRGCECTCIWCMCGVKIKPGHGDKSHIKSCEQALTFFWFLRR